MKIKTVKLLCAMFALSLFCACATTKDAKVAEQKEMLKTFIAQRETGEKNLKTFDELDFVVYSNQEWTRLHESHAKDILVHYPDGSTTKGLADHITELKKTFVFAPDTSIKEHPIRIGSGNYTAVTGVMTGTFSKPMPMGNGKFIQPTNKKFKINMATFGIWENGVMKEEYLFWDNQSFMKQIGVGN
ncbi:hypothetical protein Dip510_001330 [Elusimicrobium posterum]|uniref:ester cyclase n=1 Tax=Elusimicrobium posterum TaxID=3116653 RepID=UPI003C74F879